MSRPIDEKPSRALRGRAGRMRGGRGSGQASTGAVRLWGRHAVEAALLNPERQHRKLWATREGVASLNGELPADFKMERGCASLVDTQLHDGDLGCRINVTKHGPRSMIESP